MHSTKTRQDALNLIDNARTGCMVDVPTLEYMVALRDELKKWLWWMELDILREKRHILKEQIIKEVQDNVPYMRELDELINKAII
jgi:hypothetical protein